MDCLRRKTKAPVWLGPAQLPFLALALPTVRAVLAYACDTPRLVPAMRRNVLICLLTPVLMALGLLLS